MGLSLSLAGTFRSGGDAPSDPWRMHGLCVLLSGRGSCGGTVSVIYLKVIFTPFLATGLFAVGSGGQRLVGNGMRMNNG